MSREYATKSFQTPEDRRAVLIWTLEDDLIERGYSFFNLDGNPRNSPDLREKGTEFEFARSIRKLPRSGFLWQDRNYFVQIAGKFDMKDPFKVKVSLFGKDEMGVIERMLSDFNSRYKLEPETEFSLNLKSPDHQIWTTKDYRGIMRELKNLYTGTGSKQI